MPSHERSPSIEIVSVSAPSHPKKAALMNSTRSAFVEPTRTALMESTRTANNQSPSGTGAWTKGLSAPVVKEPKGLDALVKGPKAGAHQASVSSSHQAKEHTQMVSASMILAVGGLSLGCMRC